MSYALLQISGKLRACLVAHVGHIHRVQSVKEEKGFRGKKGFVEQIAQPIICIEYNMLYT